jgi:uncharacterized protein YlaI
MRLALLLAACAADGEWRRVGNHIAPAFQWAQSDEDVELLFKFAHKIDAPGVSVKAEDLSVRVDRRRLEVDARTAAKAFHASLDLRHAVDAGASRWERKARGVFVLLKKEETRRWTRLLRAKAPTHLWFDRQDDLDDRDRRSRKLERRWLRNYPHACEACHLAVDRAVADGPRNASYGTLCARAAARFPTKTTRGLYTGAGDDRKDYHAEKIYVSKRTTASSDRSVFSRQFRLKM